MGKRDYRHREPKKAKKTAKKPTIVLMPPASAIIEVVPKKGKRLAEEGA